MFRNCEYPEVYQYRTQQERDDLLRDARLALRESLGRENNGFVCSFWPDVLTIKERPAMPICAVESYTPPCRSEIARDQLHTTYFQRMFPTELAEQSKDFARCFSCGTCMTSCPEKAIMRRVKKNGSYEYVSDPDRCIGCGVCRASVGLLSVRHLAAPGQCSPSGAELAHAFKNATQAWGVTPKRRFGGLPAESPFLDAGAGRMRLPLGA